MNRFIEGGTAYCCILNIVYSSRTHSRRSMKDISEGKEEDGALCCTVCRTWNRII